MNKLSWFGWMYVAPLLGAVIAGITRNNLLVPWLDAPPIVLSAWAFFGHLVTYDDDLPGGWSNQGNSRSIWRRSQFEVFVKGGMLGAALFVFAKWT